MSRIGFGAGHLHALSEAECERLLLGVVDAGVSLIDTARSYAHSEERIGRYLASRRDEITLSTKVGYGIDGVEDWTPECIRAGIEEARQRLRADVIDIVHLHSCDLAVLQTEGVVEALLQARDAGHIKSAAYSGDNAELQWALKSGHFDTVQTSINVCDCAALELIAKHDVRVLAKRPLANAPWRFAERPDAFDLGIYYDRWQEVKNRIDGDPAEAALRFAAFQKGVDHILVGTRSLEHLNAALRAVSRGPLARDATDAIRGIAGHWPQIT